MAFQMTYPKTLTLSQLKRRMRIDEGLAGSVTAIGHSDSNTLADFDEGAPPDGELLLVKQDATGEEERNGHTFICGGAVWVESALKKVAAYRAGSTAEK